MNYIGDYSILEIQGADAINFLHNLTTNAFAEKENSVIYSCLLTPNGRFMYDFLLHQTNGKKYISIHKDAQNGFIAYISMFKMQNDVQFLETNLALLWNDKPFENSIEDPRKTQLGYYKISEKQGEDFSKEYHINRIKNLVPDGYLDMTQKSSIILEFGLDDLNAICYTKGCYLGQELISRTKHTGVIRRHVVYKFSEKPLQKGEEILENDDKIGEILGGVNEHYLCLVLKK